MKARSEYDACGARTRRLTARGRERACRDCRRLSEDKWAAAVVELARIRRAESNVRITLDPPDEPAGLDVPTMAAAAAAHLRSIREDES